MPDNELKSPKVKMCRTAVAGLAVFVLTIVSLITPIANLFLIAAGAFISFSLAIISLFIIALSPVPMRGRVFSNTTLALSMISLLFLGTGPSRCAPPPRIFCAIQLSQIGKALLAYQSDLGNLPDMSQWQDELIAKADLSEQLFVCRGSHNKGSSYAINKYIYDVSSEHLPKDLVILFEAVPPFEGARNISGGPELINIANHDYLWMNVVLGDGYVRFVRPKEITGLNWSTKPDFVFPSEVASYIDLNGKEQTHNNDNFKYPVKTVTSIIILLVIAVLFLRLPIVVYILVSVIAALLWSEFKSTLYSSKMPVIIFYSVFLWTMACGVIHIILKKLRPAHPEAFTKGLPALVGMVIGIVIGILWLIPDLLFLQSEHVERFLTGETWFTNIAINGIWGFWFGMFEGLVWEKLFVTKKSDLSDKSKGDSYAR